MNRYLYSQNDPVNFLDPTGKAANKAGMGDMPQDNLTGDALWVEAYAATPFDGYDDFTVTISLQESGGGIWGGNLSGGIGFAYDGDTGAWDIGLVGTEGGGSFAGAGRSYVVEIAVSGGDELSDLNGTTAEFGASVSTIEGPCAGVSVNVPYPAMDFSNPIVAVNFGFSLGTPIEGHFFINNTQTKPFEQTPSTNPKQEGTN